MNKEKFDFSFPIEKYKFVEATDGNGIKRVIAMSSYHGRHVKGVAKCDPSDSYDFELGKKLAAARCDVKVCNKRLNSALNKYNLASKAYDKAFADLAEMSEYVKAAVSAVNNSSWNLSLLESKIGVK